MHKQIETVCYMADLSNMAMLATPHNPPVLNAERRTRRNLPRGVRSRHPHHYADSANSAPAAASNTKYEFPMWVT